MAGVGDTTNWSGAGANGGTPSIVPSGEQGNGTEIGEKVSEVIEELTGDAAGAESGSFVPEGSTGAERMEAFFVNLWQNMTNVNAPLTIITIAAAVAAATYITVQRTAWHKARVSAARLLSGNRHIYSNRRILKQRARRDEILLKDPTADVADIENKIHRTQSRARGLTENQVLHQRLRFARNLLRDERFMGHSKFTSAPLLEGTYTRGVAKSQARAEIHAAKADRARTGRAKDRQTVLANKHFESYNTSANLSGDAEIMRNGKTYFAAIPVPENDNRAVPDELQFNWRRMSVLDHIDNDEEIFKEVNSAYVSVGARTTRACRISYGTGKEQKTISCSFDDGKESKSMGYKMLKAALIKEVEAASLAGANVYPIVITETNSRFASKRRSETIKATNKGRLTELVEVSDKLLDVLKLRAKKLSTTRQSEKKTNDAGWLPDKLDDKGPFNSGYKGLGVGVEA